MICINYTKIDFIVTLYVCNVFFMIFILFTPLPIPLIPSFFPMNLISTLGLLLFINSFITVEYSCLIIEREIQREVIVGPGTNTVCYIVIFLIP